MADLEPHAPPAGDARYLPVPLSEEEGAALRRQLARAVARACPSWLADHAEDIVQCAWIKAAQGLREGREGLAPSYLWRVAYSATVDEIRRRRRRREVALEEALAGGPAVSAAPDPARLREAQEIGQGLRECLRGLDEPRRLAVTLHLQGHSVPEAARILGWGAKQVENLVYRGLEEVRRGLRAKGLAP